MNSANKHKQSARSKRPKLSLLIAPLIIIVLAGIISFDVSERFQREQVSKFEAQTHDVLHQATMKLDNYSDILYTGRAFSLSSQAVTPKEWKSFYNQQSVFSRYPGVSSISYVNSVQTQDLAAFRAKMAGNDYFGPSYQLKEMSGRPTHGLISALVSESDISVSIGMDVLARDERYEVYKAAEVRNTIAASAPTTLVTGYKGFFTVLPVFKGDTLDGYVLATFRFDDLMSELFNDDSFGYKVSDVTSESSNVIYSSNIANGDVNRLERIIDVGDRRWKVEISKKTDDRPLGFLLPVAVMTTGVVMAITLYAYSTVSGRERATRKK